MGRGVPLPAQGCPLLSPLGDLEERRISRPRKRFWGVSCAFHAYFSAFDNCLEMGDSYIPFLESDAPFNFLGVSGRPRHPQWLRQCLNVVQQYARETHTALYSYPFSPQLTTSHIFYR